ncbi:MAG: helix-turn-helix domain-containing protein [Pseudomonadota bacterium]|nr:helix-turn-helix domain-containing protein [Pseudomonadota bacterium]
MVLDADSAYLALKARDARFDGRLFVGVTSTGVYCRPVCRVRTPRRENCRFFDSRAQAEAAAFRPCMKCRPEIAPGFSHTDSSRMLADSAARFIEHAVHAGEATGVMLLAARLGVTDRHLRRIFQRTHGVAPREYIGTQRLLLAKQLLSDTTLPITQVALASGFDSVRRFNAAFLARYRFAPTRLRREASNSGPLPRRSPMTLPPALKLAYRPPYDIEAVLAFLARRAVRGIAEVDGLAWRHTVGWAQRGQQLAGYVEARFEPSRNEVHLRASDSLSPVLGALLQRVRQALDLDADPSSIDPVMALLPVPVRPGARLPGGLDGFEIAVCVILGQQVTVKAARTLVQRVVDRYGQPVETPFPALSHLFPTPQALAAADPETFGKLGIVRQRVGAIQALARAVVEERLHLNRAADLTQTLATLHSLPGVGDWTAQVIAMRALAWPDAWPASDIGLMNALGSRNPRELIARAEPWRPWRGYAVMQLWHHLETQWANREKPP